MSIVQIFRQRQMAGPRNYLPSFGGNNSRKKNAASWSWINKYRSGSHLRQSDSHISINQNSQIKRSGNKVQGTWLIESKRVTSISGHAYLIRPHAICTRGRQHVSTVSAEKLWCWRWNDHYVRCDYVRALAKCLHVIFVPNLMCK